MQIKYYFFSLLFLITACKKKKSVDDYLTNGNLKYWYAISDYPMKNTYGVCFTNNGTFCKYIRNDAFQKNLMPKNYDKRILIENLGRPVWRVINDTTFMYGKGLNLRIIYIDENVFILRSLEARNTLILISDTDQTTKPIKDKNNYSIPTF